MQSCKNCTYKVKSGEYCEYCTTQLDAINISNANLNRRKIMVVKNARTC